MGKRKWQRVRLEDLASEAEQERVLRVMDQARGQSAPVSPEKQASETPQVERSGGEPSAPLHVIACPHPFKLAHEEHSFAPTLSLAQVLQEIQPDDLLRRRAHIWVNDTYIGPEKWESTYPEAGSHIDIRVVPAGRAMRTIGRVFVAIAAIVVAIAIPFLAPASWGLISATGGLTMWGAMAGGLAGMAVGIVGNMALNALFPPARPGGPGTLSALAAVPGADYGQSSPTLAITGAKNRENRWGPVPFILGRYRVFPFLGASPYTESAGGDQYLRLFFVWVSNKEPLWKRLW